MTLLMALIRSPKYKAFFKASVLFLSHHFCSYDSNENLIRMHFFFDAFVYFSKLNHQTIGIKSDFKTQQTKESKKIRFSPGSSMFDKKFPKNRVDSRKNVLLNFRDHKWN